MRPSSSRRPSGRLSDSPRRDSVPLVAEAIYNPSLPSYAQATIAHTQRSSISNGKGSVRGLGLLLLPLKAGTGKTLPTLRPTSSRRSALNAIDTSLQAKSTSSPVTPLKKRPSFVDLFRTNSPQGPEQDNFIGTNSGGDKSTLPVSWKKSPGYKSPKLIQLSPRGECHSSPSAITKTTHSVNEDYKVAPLVRVPSSGSLKFDKNDDLFQSMFKDMESALQEVLHSNDENMLNLEDNPEQLKKLASGDSVSSDQWEALVDLHLKQTSYYKNRLEIDHQLITKVLEVNNELYSRCETYQRENEKLKREWGLLANDLGTSVEEHGLQEMHSLENEDNELDQELSQEHIRSHSSTSMNLNHQQLFSPLIRNPGTFSTTRSQTSASVAEDPLSTEAATANISSPGIDRYKKVFQTLGSSSFF